ncbi:MAG: nucleotide pyrophosphohydrolase [Deltaproteobacteria bacterium]|nr:MAG: nucleotide pyrophosphohydrolase [Deltaproteobacteria bacterium]
MTLTELQQVIDQWISQYEEGYWPPLANLARLTEEVGELARELNHAHGSKPKKTGESSGSVDEELGDIVFAAATLANSLGIDLEAAVRGSVAKVRRRDDRRFVRKKADEPSGA